MPEARNNFLKSKMNKDLEQRLVPVGEYRDAINVMISRSEGDDVGALENVLGNALLSDFSLNDEAGSGCCGEEVIGYFMDMINDRIFVFTSNFSDTSTDQLSDFAPTSALCGIFVYDLSNNTITNIVKGYYLNFSKTHEITGVNVIEQYLFWTDNRNQPRKINITRALGNTSYYTNEDQISVSKYYPHESPLLINKEINGYTVTLPGSGYSDGDICTLESISGADGTAFQLEVLTTDPVTGEILTIKILNLGTGYGVGNYYIVNPNDPNVATWAQLDLSEEWLSTMYNRTDSTLADGVAPNPLYDPAWDGDKNWLKDKFVRFAYRFKFDDGEYSLISPFTQECFVPEQDGYFIKNWNGTSNLFEKNDDDKTYTSTEVDFMQNKINEIDLVINAPNGTWSNSIDALNIVEIDIIYKQSNEQNLRVVETLEVSDGDEAGSVYGFPFLKYKYKSEAPYKTLPDKDLLRVYDKVPVRAKTQEWAENRVIYGNFFDKPTPPDTLNYIVGVNEKTGDDEDNLRIEYQNHTVKQNRSYQAGIVLSDRYGRQSSVILANDDASTYFHPFKDGGNTQGGCTCLNCVDFAANYGSQNSFSWYDTNATSNNLLGPYSPTGPTDTWPGDCLNLTFIDTINSIFNSDAGTPGLYQGYGVIEPTAIEWISYGSVCSPVSFDSAYFAGQGSGTGMSLTIDSVDPVTGAIEDITFTNLGEGYQQGDTFTIGFPDCSEPAQFRLLNVQPPNPLGWYSWKVVVKQPQTDYYNVYTAGMLNGFIDGEGPNAGFADDTLIGATPQLPIAHFAVYGDNINKIPRDLSLVGPTQNVFRSGRPSVADDPSYYDFVDTSGTPFTVNPYESDAEVILKQRDRELALDSGSQINNALVNLSPRVINSPGGDSLSDGTQLKQWYPGEVYSTVVTLGTGVELGLWDPSANQPYNTAPVFYGYENNPLIAKMNIGVSIPAQNTPTDCERGELNLFGRYGPSPDGGMLRYSVGPSGVVGGAGNQGEDYVPTSKNVGGKPLPGTSTHPAPFNKTGEDGTGILFNITGVDDNPAGGGSLTSDPNIVGPLKDRGINVANNEGQNGVKGFISPDNTYPYDVQYQIIGSGNGEGKVRVTVEKEKWPGYMEPNLAILETQAFESKLDIYWETSTSGLVGDLNDRILAGDEFAVRNLNSPGNLSLNYIQRENAVPGSNVFSTEIAAFSGAGTIVDDTTMPGPVTMSLDSVESQGVGITGFELVPGSTGGHYILQITDYHTYCTPAASNTYEFVITVKSPTATYPLDGTFQFETFTFVETLLNSTPINNPFDPGCPAPAVLSKASVVSWPEEIRADLISNGTPWDAYIVEGSTQVFCGINWITYKDGAIVKVLKSDGEAVNPGPNTFSWNVSSSGGITGGIQIFFEEAIPLDTYTISYGAFDAGGLSFECTFEIQVTS